MTLCSVITETIVIADPHAGHRSGWTSKMRRSIRAQLAREGEGPGSGCGWGPASRAPPAARAPRERLARLRLADRIGGALRALFVPARLRSLTAGSSTSRSSGQGVVPGRGSGW